MVELASPDLHEHTTKCMEGSCVLILNITAMCSIQIKIKNQIIYRCPSDNTKSRKYEVTDAFVLPFHTGINVEYRGVTDTNVINFFFRFLLSNGHPQLVSYLCRDFRGPRLDTSSQSVYI